LELETIDLDHDTICFKREMLPFLNPALVIIFYLIEVAE